MITVYSLKDIKMEFQMLDIFFSPFYLPQLDFPQYSPFYIPPQLMGAAELDEVLILRAVSR